MARRKEGAGIAAAVRLLGKLPLGLVTALGGLLGGLIGVAPLRWATPRRLVMINLLVCYPFMSWHEVRRLTRRAMRQTGRTLCEFSHVWTRPVEESLARISQVEGLDAYREAVRSGEPVLVLSLHQSSWELINLLLGREGGATVMYQPDRQRPALDELVRHARERTGCRLVPADARGVKAALGTLNDKGVVALLADHNPGLNNPFVPFFGHPVATPALIYKLVKRYRPRVFFVSCYRGEGFHDVRVCFERALSVEEGADEFRTLLAVNQGLEMLINRSPVQYQWNYKRFRRAPDGIRPWYRQSVRIIRAAQQGGDRESLGLMPSSSEGQQHGH